MVGVQREKYRMGAIDADPCVPSLEIGEDLDVSAGIFLGSIDCGGLGFSREGRLEKSDRGHDYDEKNGRKYT